MSPFKGEALKEVMGKIQRPLAGCDDLSVIKAKNPKEICSYVPLRGVIIAFLCGMCHRKSLILRPLAGCDGKNEQK